VRGRLYVLMDLETRINTACAHEELSKRKVTGITLHYIT